MSNISYTGQVDKSWNQIKANFKVRNLSTQTLLQLQSLSLTKIWVSQTFSRQRRSSLPTQIVWCSRTATAVCLTKASNSLIPSAVVVQWWAC